MRSLPRLIAMAAMRVLLLVALLVESGRAESGEVKVDGSGTRIVAAHPFEFLAPDFPENHKRFTNGWEARITVPPGLPVPHRAAGIVVYRKSPMAGHGQEKWRKGGDRFVDAPTRVELIGESGLSDWATRGEIGAFVFQVAALDRVEGLSVHVGDFKGSGPFDLKNIEVRWLQHSGAAWNAYKPEPYEKSDGALVRPRKGRVLQPGGMDEYWVLYQVPAGTAPGKYQAVAELHIPGRPNVSFPLQIEVLSTELVPTRFWWGHWYHVKETLPFPERLAVLRKDLALLKAWGYTVNAPDYSLVRVPTATNPGEADFGELLQVLRAHADAGFRTFIWYGWGEAFMDQTQAGSSRAKSKIQAPDKAIINHSRAIGSLLAKNPDLPDVVLCVSDEVKAVEDLSSISAWTRVASEQKFKRIRFAYIANRPDPCKALDGICEIGFVNAGAGPTLEAMRNGLAKGTSIVAYNAGFGRSGYGWRAWCLSRAARGASAADTVNHAPIGGMVEYIYGQQIDGNGDDTFVINLDWREAKIIPTSHWIGTTRGMFEARGLETLEVAAAKFGAKPWAQEVVRFLDVVAQSGKEESGWRMSWEPEKYEELRSKLGDLLRSMPQE